MKKQIKKTAILTTPIISFLVVAPVFIVKEDNHYHFMILWGLVIFATSLCWVFNFLLLNTFRQAWLRFLIIFISILMIGTTLVYCFKIIPPQTNLSYLQILLLRSLCLLSINLIIAILINLITSKEKQLLLNKEIADLQFANLEAQYKFLKDQINPHFLFNALNISKSLIEKQPQKAKQYIILLADFLRSTIDYNQKSATLADELKVSDNFIALQKLRFDDAIKYTVNIADEMMNKHLPFFALVTLLENTTKHNSFTIEKPLNINIFTEEDFIVVQNNKQQKFALNSGKTGLININERSKILNGNEIQIEDGATIFSVKIKLM